MCYCVYLSLYLRQQRIPSATPMFSESSNTFMLLWIISDYGVSCKSNLAAINRKYIFNSVCLSWYIGLQRDSNGNSGSGNTDRQGGNIVRCLGLLEIKNVGHLPAIEMRQRLSQLYYMTATTFQWLCPCSPWSCRITRQLRRLFDVWIGEESKVRHINSQETDALPLTFLSFHL